MGSSLFLGVDGGQSHSVAVLTDQTGQVLGTGWGGPCNHFDEPGGEERLRSVLSHITLEAFRDAGLPVQKLAAAYLGLTGAWDHAFNVFQSLLPVERLTAVEDTVIAQAGAFAGAPGIVVIAGTGAVAYGRDETGRIARADGWGYLLGDEGSGYDIGRRSLRAAARAFDERGPATVLLDMIPAYFTAVNLEAVGQAVYSGQLSRADVAGLAVVVGRAAANGDPVARAILEEAAASLAQTVVAVAQRLSWDVPPVSPVGGVFEAGTMIYSPFEHTLAAKLPGVQLVPPRYPPVLGAVLLALREAGHTFSQVILEHLDQANINSKPEIQTGRDQKC